VNTIQEAQALMAPVMMLLMLPLLSMVPIGRDPNGAFAKVMSYIPPFTPFVMMNRAAGPPTIWEYIGTSVLLLAAVAGALWAAAKIFRIGILMTGKPPKAREIFQWIRTPVGMTPGRRE
jgi:ABC-type Na+ efflux pump permease subunit